MRSISKLMMILLFVLLALLPFTQDFTSIHLLLEFHLLSLVIITLFLSRTSESYIKVLIIIILMSIVIKLIFFSNGITLVGIDPHRYASWTEITISSGRVPDRETSGFYSFAPIFILFSSTVTAIFNVSVDTSFIIYPIIIGLTTPMLAFLFTRVLSQRRDLAMVSAIVICLAAITTRYSYWPIAQTLSSIYFLFFSYHFLLLFRDKYQGRNIVCTLLFITSILYTHKLGIILISIVLLAFSAILIMRWGISDSKILDGNEVWHILGLSLLASILTYIQMNESGYIVGIIYSLITTSPSSAQMVPSGAINTHPPIINILLVNSTMVVYFALAFIGWVALSMNLSRKSEAFNLAVISTTVSISVLGILVFPSLLGGSRVIGYAEVILVSFIISSTSYLHYKNINQKKIVSAVILAILLTNIFASPFLTPNEPGYTRQYLYESEVSAVEFSNEYVSSTQIYSDSVVFHYMDTDPELKTQEKQYNNINNNIVNSDYQVSPIIFRKESSVYYVPNTIGSNYWKLTYTPTNKLRQNHNAIYSSGNTGIYF